MKKQVTEYKINRNQYISQIEPFKSKGIPTNIILFKTIPGCGATRCEIEFPRHSILLEPNVPVINGKSQEFSRKVLGIYEGITTDHILEYLKNNVEFKKLIVTPESFWKVKQAVEESAFELYNDFFLLFDECEKIIQDISYRPDISLPMDDFFRFKNKAFVSATPILPSDPRFKANEFSIVKLAPIFNYSENIKLIITNNIINSFDKFIKENPRDRYFIFLNSSDITHEIITKFNIKEESMMFCSDISRRKMILNGYNRSSVQLALTTFKKFNFLTSRLYSAVDIDFSLYKGHPTIVMISDIVNVNYTMIDPHTEAIQIQGRFRIPKGKSIVKTIVHITNVNPEIIARSREQTIEYLRGCHLVYKAINRYYESASTIAAKDVLRQMLQKIDYAKFLKPNSEKRNWDMIDNLIAEERVKCYYQSSTNLMAAYNNSEHFNLNATTESYSYTDADRRKSNRKNVRLKSLYKIISQRLQVLYALKLDNKITDFNYNMEIVNFQTDFPVQMRPINRFGFDASAELGFDIYLIEKKLKEDKKFTDHFGMMTFIHSNFIIGNAYTSNQINRILTHGFKQNKIGGKKGSVQFLREFAKLSPNNNKAYMGKDDNGKPIRGYKVFSFLDNGNR